MSKENNKYSLIKFGLSEIKRKNLKQIYTFYCYWIKSNSSKTISSNEIFDNWKDIGVYEDAKKEAKISREITFLQNNYLAAIESLKSDKNTYTIHSTEISDNWENDEEFYSLSNIDFSFFQFMLKQKYKINGKDKSAFFSIFSYLIKNRKIMPDIIISDEYKNHIQNVIISNDYNNILKLVSYNSGSTIEKRKKDELRDNLIKTFVGDYVSKEFTYKKSIISLNEYLEFLKKNNDEKPADGILELILNNEKSNDEKNFNYSKWKKGQEKEKIIEKIKIINKEDFVWRVIKRIIFGGYSSYKNLIINHINCLSCVFDINSKDEFKIRDKNFEKALSNILQDEEKILSLKTEKFYSSKDLIRIFDLKYNNESKPLELQNENDRIINSVYSKKKLDQILKEINNAISGDKPRYKDNEINNIILNHEHIKGQVNWPTFYEFIIGMIFLKKEYGFESTNWKDKISKHLNLKIDGSLCPIRFAGAGITDISFNYNKGFCNIEPTTQLYRQTGHEYDSVIDHLEKTFNERGNNYGISIIAAPVLEDKLEMAVDGWNNKKIKENKQIILFDKNALSNFLNNDISLKEASQQKWIDFVEQLNKISKDEYIIYESKVI